MCILKAVIKIVILETNSDIKQVFVIVGLIEAFNIVFGELLAKRVFKPVFPLQINFLTLDSRPNAQLVAKLFANSGKQVFQGIKRTD